MSSRWTEAETDLKWFEQRLKEDPDCGVDLINFMKLLDSDHELSGAATKILNTVRAIVDPNRIFPSTDGAAQ